MPEQLVDLRYPTGGVDRTYSFSNQFVRQLDSGPATTCRDALNTRGYDTATTRFRGASRTGITQLIRAPLAGVPWVVQDMNIVIGSGFTPPGGQMQNSQSGRIVLLVAVAQGQIYSAAPGDTAYTPAINATGVNPPLNFSGLMYSAPNIQKLWIVDGVNAVVYTASTNTANLWTASAGQFPKDNEGNLPRLICTWRGRTVLSGLLNDPQNIFMTAVSDPTNFDYSPQSVTPTQAVALNLSPLGLVGDVVTCLIPYSDDVLIVGCDSSIYIIAGDPMAGGQVDRVTNSIGMAFGKPWCVDPMGTIYFFSQKTGIFSMVPGQEPQRMSQGIEQLLLDVNTGTNSIHLQWEDRVQAVRLFITPLAAPGKTTHFTWEQRMQAWTPDRFASPAFDPLCSCVLDGNGPEDRVVLIGSYDGFIRALDPFATKDDWLDIDSFVLLGPINTPLQDVMSLKDLQAILGETSSDVKYEVFIGETAESALDNPAVESGIWTAGHNPLSYVARDARAIYVKLSSSNPWSMETIKARIDSDGRVRQRGKDS